MRLRALLALLTFLIPVGAAAVAPPRLEHVAVWVKDIDATAKALDQVLGWRRHPLEFGVNEDSLVFGGMKLAFVDANGIWLELVQPTTPGPGMEFLKQKGNGSVVELDFFVDDFDAAVAALRAKGVAPMGMDDKPMKDQGILREWAIVDGKRVEGVERLAYLPVEVARGTSIELGWEYPSGVVIRRDQTWSAQQRTPASTPRVDHVVVAAADLEKTAAVYSHILELKRLSGVPGLPRDWMGVDTHAHAWIKSPTSVWVDVVAPAGTACGKFLKDSRFGDGSIVELAAEVPDLNAFAAQMQSKGIALTATVTPTGDRYAYLPSGRVENMRILIFERSKSPQGALNRRDAGK